MDDTHWVTRGHEHDLEEAPVPRWAEHEYLQLAISFHLSVHTWMPDRMSDIRIDDAVLPRARSDLHAVNVMLTNLPANCQ
ncbi:hypothetical protein [Agromyces rhizosphaerae]|uniref:hypothetical protein n=1 Tax=Agromyces rhizosphaerae TaxID=88374 RepID=UPI0035A220FD